MRNKMRKLITSFGLAFCLLSIPITNASLSVSVGDIPPAVDADSYTLHITTSPGAKITVTGGLSEVPPVTDTDEDGEVEVTIGLIQNSNNSFSIRAELDGNSSETLTIIINENAAEAEAYSQSSGVDITPPSRPILDDYETEVNANQITLTGIAETDATIIASKTDGTQITTTQADTDSTFSITVPLEQNKRNRINISARDSSGNISQAIQAVIVEDDDGEIIEVEEVEEVIEEVAIEIEEFVSSFSDITNHWAKNYITTLQQKDIVSGKNKDTFAPNDYLTRAELTKIALYAFDFDTITINYSSFADVDINDWYAPFVETAKNEGIITGYVDGFHPNQNITRAEAIKILLTTAGFEILEAATDFDDVSSNAWYEKYIAFAKNNGIVSGYSDGTFRPDYPITRGEIAKITVKTIELYGKTMESSKQGATNDSTDETDDTGDTGDTDTELLTDQQLYENTNFNFSLQFYKNWFYEGITGSGNTIIKIGFSDDEEAIDNALVTLELKNDSLDNLGKTNLDTEAIGTEIRYFVEYSDSRHIEIYGSTDYTDKIQIMAETTKVE